MKIYLYKNHENNQKPWKTMKVYWRILKTNQNSWKNLTSKNIFKWSQLKLEAIIIERIDERLIAFYKSAIVEKSVILEFTQLCQPTRLLRSYLILLSKEIFVSRQARLVKIRLKLVRLCVEGGSMIISEALLQISTLSLAQGQNSTSMKDTWNFSRDRTKRFWGEVVKYTYLGNGSMET